jgi:hypothetical protein
MAQVKKAFHAFVGSGDLAVEKSRAWADQAVKTSTRAYGDLAGRGERALNRVRRAKPARRAAEGTRQATRQLKGAYTSIRKALGAQPPAKPSRRAS